MLPNGLPKDTEGTDNFLPTSTDIEAGVIRDPRLTPLTLLIDQWKAIKDLPEVAVILHDFSEDGVEIIDEVIKRLKAILSDESATTAIIQGYGAGTILPLNTQTENGELALNVLFHEDPNTMGVQLNIPDGEFADHTILSERCIDFSSGALVHGISLMNNENPRGTSLVVSFDISSGETTISQNTPNILPQTS